MTPVSLLTCHQYDPAVIEEKILECLRLLQIDTGIFHGKRVGLKPNLLTSIHPDSCVVTHPEFFRSIVRIVRKSGGNPLLIENPAVIPLEKVLLKTGYRKVVESEKVEVADVRKTIQISGESDAGYKHFEVSRALSEIDILINIPKLKTHSLTSYTGAVKNMLGTIPGLRKAEWHIKASSKETFSGMLVDLYMALKKGLPGIKTIIHVMDAIKGMEGEGPGSSGSPRHIGALLVSGDPVAMDFVASDLVGLDTHRILTTVIGSERGAGVSGYENIEIRGEEKSSFEIEDFIPAPSDMNTSMLPVPFFPELLRSLTLQKPVPRKGICSLCLQCGKICPAGAITKKTGGKKQIPDFDYDKCIRCYCCMEICPEAAIKVKNGLLTWVLRIR